MHIPSGSLSQMTEEEHVRIAKRIGLIQHLPVGYYDGTGSRRHESSSEASKDTTTKPTNNNNQFNLTISEDSVCSECLVYFLGNRRNRRSPRVRTNRPNFHFSEKEPSDKEEDCMTSSTLSSNSRSECVICMYDFQIGDRIRYLPCLHVYHDICIDDWLMRSLTCPSCLEPVDAALLQTYENN